MPIYGQRRHGCRTDEYVWRGHRIVTLENELLRITIAASKGADILEFRYKPHDLDVLWSAPQPLAPAGHYVPTRSRLSGAFMDYYPGGWQELFPSAGPAACYAGGELGVHGETPLLPWDVKVLADTANRVEVEFTVETFRFPFRLSRRMIVESGKALLRLEERVENLSAIPLPCMWAHHPAFGAPFVEAGCLIEAGDCAVSVPAYSEALPRRFAISSGNRFPFVPRYDGQPARVDEVQGIDTRTEDVLELCNFRNPWVAVRNPSRALAVALTWDGSTFPYVWCWQLYGGRVTSPYFGRGYALALEPSTSPVMPLEDCAAGGMCPTVGALGSLDSYLEAGIYETSSPIGEVRPGGVLIGKT